MWTHRAQRSRVSRAAVASFACRRRVPRLVTVLGIIGVVTVSAGLSACAEIESSGEPSVDANSAPTPAPDGGAIYAKRCAVCHDDDGSGARGPALADGRMVSRYEDVDDQVRIVRIGVGEMPAFRDRLTDDEIAAVVEYTRTALVSDG